MADHTVTITVHPETGSISITPTSLQVSTVMKKGAGATEEVPVTPSIGWEVQGDRDAPWLVFFEDGAAFEIKSATKPERNPVHSVEVRNGQVAIATGKKKGTFQYKLAVYTQKKIYAVMACPEVIIK